MKEYKTRKTHTGSVIYIDFDRPTNITHLDKDIINNTLCYNAFCAHMADDYNNTKAELQAILKYRKQINWIRSYYENKRHCTSN